MFTAYTFLYYNKSKEVTTYLSTKVQDTSYFKGALQACNSQLSLDCTSVFASEFNRVVISAA